MTTAEIAAVITGLRMLQANIIERREPRGLEGISLMEIYTNGETLTPLTAEQIDALCERLSTSQP